VCVAVAANGKLEVIDSSAAQTGKITGGNIDGSGGGVWVEGDFTLSSGSITGNKAGDANTDSIGAGVMVYGGEFTMNGGTISKNILTNGKTYALGGGVCVNNGGKFTMNGGEISENENQSTKTPTGLGVYVEDSGSQFILNGGKITKHGLTDKADNAVDVEAGGKLIINGGEISGNVTNYGAVHASSAESFEMNGGKICNNRIRSSAEGNKEIYGGAGTYLYNTSFTMNGGEISGNTTPIGPSAVSLDATASFKMTGGIITDNTTTAMATIKPLLAAGSVQKTVPFGAVSQFMDFAGKACTIELAGGKIVGNHGGGVRPTMYWNQTGTNASAQSNLRNSMTQLIISGPAVVVDNDDWDIYLASRGYVGGSTNSNFFGIMVKLQGNPVKDGYAPNIGLY
ncbi:MAG: hypothetical protein K2K28_03675, partial [Clostridia bacterium]|nr:hypothetical protein [Clostridia bacterium]